MKEFMLRHRTIVGSIFVVISVAVAIVYLLIVPEQAIKANDSARIILLYGHSVCWLLLGASVLVWTLQKSNALRATLLYSALAVYAVFIITLMTVQT